MNGAPAGPDANAHGTMRRQAVVAALALLALGLAGLRLIHLEADTPPGLSWSAGLYVDEGYKTISARNLALFGDYHWHPADGYGGSHGHSPIMHWLNYAAYRLGGVRAESARVVTAAFFAVLLGVFTILSRRRHPPWVTAAGLLLLGLQSMLFFFSRVALWEMPLTVVLYVAFLAAREIEGDLKAVAVLAGAGVVTVFGIKMSALLYLAPALAAAVVVLIVRHRKRLARPAVIAGAVAALGAGAWLAYRTHTAWLPRLSGLSFARWRVDFVGNPMFELCWPYVLAGGLAGLHSLLRSPGEFVRDRLRMMLLFVAWLTPPVLALFKYDPIRYYVPILPAYGLLTAEWLSDRPWRRPTDARSSGVRLALRAALSAAVAAALVLAAADSWRRVGGFVAHPTYEARETRARLAAVVPPGQGIAGDWAPFLALGTSIPALYMNRVFNHPSQLHKLKIPFFLHSGTQDSNHCLRRIRRAKGVKLGRPVARSSYNGKKIWLFPLRYDEAARPSVDR